MIPFVGEVGILSHLLTPRSTNTQNVRRVAVAGEILWLKGSTLWSYDRDALEAGKEAAVRAWAGSAEEGNGTQAAAGDKSRNPAFLLHLPQRGRDSASGSGYGAVQLALALCEAPVDLYGFSVDAGAEYTAAGQPKHGSWSHYYRRANAYHEGHAVYQGFAWYQLLECLGYVKLHTPLRDTR